MLNIKRLAVACVSAAAIAVTGSAVLPVVAQAAVAAPAASWYSDGIYTSSECEKQVEAIYLWGGTAYCEWHAPLAIGYEELWIKNG